MRSIPSNLILEKNKVTTTSAWLWILDILFTGEVSPIRFVKSLDDITYEGNLYTRMPFTLDVIRDDRSGSIENLVLKFPNVLRILEPYLEELDGAVGSIATLRLINSAYLAEEPAFTRSFEILSTESDSVAVTATLGSSNPLLKRFPFYLYRANHCNWRFNFPTSTDCVECNYTRVTAYAWQSSHAYSIGERCYKAGDTSMTFRVCDVQLDQESGLTEPVWTEVGGLYTLDNNITWICDINCIKTLKNCQDLGNSSRFGAYLGTGQGGLRLV